MMKIHFYLHYTTRFGESFRIQAMLADAKKTQDLPVLQMSYLNEEYWHGELEIPASAGGVLSYNYLFTDATGKEKQEWNIQRQIEITSGVPDTVRMFDYWNPANAVENTFFTQPFQYFTPRPPQPAKTPAHFTHLFKVQAPLLQPDEVICLLGHGNSLRNWDLLAPILLRHDPASNWWSVHLDLSREDFPLAYKYGIWNTRTQKFQGFEQGANRSLYTPPHHPQGSEWVVLQDGFARLERRPWRGSGVAIPVFSLRSNHSYGVGEFSDLPALADWAGSIGMKIIQLLPVNDSSATGTWTDSYPYAAISAFALHPIYLNPDHLAGKKHAALLQPFATRRQQLNQLEAVDYEGVMQLKWEIIRLLYPLLKDEWLKDKAYKQYFSENKHWLLPYAAFCMLRDEHGTTDFNQWKKGASYQASEVEKWAAPGAQTFDALQIHCFVQWHLHLQLKAAVDYAHARGLALKGDIPIGIYRYSCDAWVAPELYNMHQQAGAPPDDFAEKGQNWGFPTYNWARMKEDGFGWWKQRFAQMSLYFDAFRIDHILGFFRIWSIPLDAVEGILGRFDPVIPVAEQEFHQAGIGFNYDRLCRPFITEQVLQENFGALAEYVKSHFLNTTPDAGHWSGGSAYQLKPEFDNQRKVEAHFAAMGAEKGSKKKKNEVLSADTLQTLQSGLYNLISNVILFDGGQGQYHFRFGIDKTSSFRLLPDEVKSRLNALYVDYFYRRQDDFWQKEAMEKLPDLKRATPMLICGEDLGMVPHCVPDVMAELAILSLEIQRMPKKAGATFFHPKDAPYLSVVTPSTHDMSTIRGWWEEDPGLTQRFYREILDHQGDAPFFCEPWINETILAQHFHSPAMLAIFQLQDLLGMDGQLRRNNPQEERINVPANPKHYWRYRMHFSLEDLQKSAAFNNKLQHLIVSSGRA
jgi:4-alpha-glucanotransferase